MKTIVLKQMKNLSKLIIVLVFILSFNLHINSLDEYSYNNNYINNDFIKSRACNKTTHLVWPLFKNKIKLACQIKVDVNSDFNLKEFLNNDQILDDVLIDKLDVSNLDLTKLYKTNITVLDENNHSLNVIQINVIDNQAPIITTNSDNLRVLYTTSYNLLDNVSAVDNYDGDITSKVIVVDDIETSSLAVGNYKVEYQVTDSSNNLTTKTINLEIYKEDKKVFECSKANNKQTNIKNNTNNNTSANIDYKEVVSSNQVNYRPMTINFLNKSISYKNGGRSNGQAIIDANPYTYASTWGGAPVFSGTDNLNTHFIGHNPGVFSNLINANKFVVVDENGNVFTYYKTVHYYVNEYGERISDNTPLFNHITSTSGGEKITIQTCCGQNNALLIVEAVLAN